MIAPENCDLSRLIGRGRGYVDTFEKRAVAGANGHTALFIAALKIVSFVRKLGGGEDEMWRLLLYFNATKCDPPWDVTNQEELRALQHKLQEAMKKVR